MTHQQAPSGHSLPCPSKCPRPCFTGCSMPLASLPDTKRCRTLCTGPAPGNAVPLAWCGVQSICRRARYSERQDRTACAKMPWQKVWFVCSIGHSSGAQSCRQEAQRQFHNCCQTALESGQRSPVRRPSPLPMMMSAMRDPKKFHTMQAAMPR